mgnify:CR=1 FL=1
MKLSRRRSPSESIEPDDGRLGSCAPESEGVVVDETEGNGIVVWLPFGFTTPSDRAGFALRASDSSASARCWVKGTYADGPGGLEPGVPMLNDALDSGLVARPELALSKSGDRRAHV